MDKHTVHNTVSGVIGAALAIVFFMILFGKIDVIALVENEGMGDAINIFDTRHMGAADAKARVTEFLKNSPDAIDSKLEDAAEKLHLEVIDKESLFAHSSFSHEEGHCVRVGIIDFDLTDQAGRIFLFVDKEGFVKVENDC